MSTHHSVEHAHGEWAWEAQRIAWKKAKINNNNNNSSLTVEDLDAFVAGGVSNDGRPWLLRPGVSARESQLSQNKTGREAHFPFS